MSNDFFRATHFAKELKSRFNTIPLVFGGIHATIAPEDCLSVCDIVVRGEGERTFLEVVRCIEKNIDYHRLPGICFKKDGGININPCGNLEKNIDIFPFPRHLPQNMYVVHKGNVVRLDQVLFKSYSKHNGTFPNLWTSHY